MSLMLYVPEWPWVHAVLLTAVLWAVSGLV